VSAEPAHDAVGAADQEAAEARVSAAGAVLETAATALRDAEHRRDTCAAEAEGLSAQEAAEEVRALTEALAEAEEAAYERNAVAQRLHEARVELTGLTGRQAAAATVIAGLRQAMIGHQETIRAVADELSGAGSVGGSVQESADELSVLADLVERAALVVETAERARERAEELRRQTGDSVEAQGFASLEEARAARLDPDDQERLLELAQERGRAATRALDVLAETGPEASDDDLAGLTLRLTEAAEAASASHRRLHLAEDRATALDGLLTRLNEAVESWAPLRDRSLRAEAMAQLVRGMGQDNQLQMRLSAYVLATRLDQVVDAANERLGHMRDQRYLLQRTDRAARKGAQAGLGLEIVDQWTGDARDPVTLSGGETFVVSLSLALGLADVVTQEAGGTEIDTLFVDEGFGTLDADTLDDVMDRLDGLRAGGRTVGVVSHVSELRNRIPTQVHVDKGRAGSSVRVTTLVG
jgi:exonuclease SbcC